MKERVLEEFIPTGRLFLFILVAPAGLNIIFTLNEGNAHHYQNEILEEGEQADLLIALRQIAKAFGGIPAIAEKAHLNPTQLYRTLSPEGNPELRSLTVILKAMNMRLAVQSLQQRK